MGNLFLAKAVQQSDTMYGVSIQLQHIWQVLFNVTWHIYDIASACMHSWLYVHLCLQINPPRSAHLHNSKNAKGRLPGLTAWYEGVQTPDLFVLGAASHSRDYRVSAGGFIHGFRYTGKSSILSMTQIESGNTWHDHYDYPVTAKAPTQFICVF